MIFWLTNPLFLALGRTRCKNACHNTTSMPQNQSLILPFFRDKTCCIFEKNNAVCFPVDFMKFLPGRKTQKAVR